MLVSFTAHGVAAPQGSKNQFGGESSKRVKPWREDIARAAGEAMEGIELARGPVGLAINFFFVRPKSHYGTGANESIVKATAPTKPIGRNTGDIDKLVRAVADALTGIVYEDDSQIQMLMAQKQWGTKARADIMVKLP